jgi:CubicO group peptidase (beta-lactamase class C family)
MKRRELFKTLGAVGAASALVEAARSPLAATAVPPLPARRRPAESDLESRLKEALEKHKVPGASVAVFQNGQLDRAAAGVVNVVTGVTMTTDTVLHIGSITKTLNATLVMQLVDEGKLQLDTSLKHYLPDFHVADQAATEAITVKMLINHTSGIDGELTPEAGHDQERIVDAIPRIAKMGQLHRPGADCSYCNSGVVLSGYLAQRITGQSWYDLVKERIFGRLGLVDSIVVPEDALLHRASVGHFLNPADGKAIRTSFAFLPLSFAPAGATAMLSAADLVTFARAHCDDGMGANGKRLLSEQSARAMRTKTASFQGPGFADFGLGWMLLDHGVLHHSGGGPGILSVVYAHPESKTAVAVLTNAAHGFPLTADLAAPVLAAVGAQPFGAGTADLVKRATDDPVDPKPYAGTYESLATAVRVFPSGSGLSLASRAKVKFYDTTSLTEGPAAPLRPIGKGQFAVGASVIGFVNPGPDGKMGHLAMGGRLLKRTG